VGLTAARTRYFSKNQVATLGDSRLAQAFTAYGYPVAGSTLVRTRQPANFFHMGTAQMGQRLRIVSPNAVSGLRSDQYMAATYTAPAFASSAHWLLTGGVVNDISQLGSGTDYFTAYIKPVCDAWIAQGRGVILMTETGSTSMASNTANLGAVYRYNRKVRQYCAETPNAVVFDVQALALDPTQTLAFKANYSGDGTHINLLQGCVALGQAFANLMIPLVPPTSWLVQTAGETFARGGVQMLNNPLWQTTTGGATATGVSGTAPAGITNYFLATGHTLAISTAGGPVGNDLVLAITASQAGTTRVQFDIANVEAAGAIMDAGCIAVLAAGSSNYQATTLHLESNRGGVTRYVEDMTPPPTAANGVLSSAALTLQLQTDPLPEDVTSRGWLTAYIRLTLAGAGSATVNIRQLGVFQRQ